MGLYRVVLFVSLSYASALACSSKSTITDGPQPPPPTNSCTLPDGGSDCAAAAIIRGQTLVMQLNCQRCHTPNLSGSTTPIADPISTDPPNTVFLYPPNLTPDPETGLGTWTAPEISRAVKDGYDKADQKLCPQMSHYADLSDDDGLAVAAYLLSLPPVHQAVPGCICPPYKTASTDGG